MQSAPKYQVFISSTFEDLRDERDQVIKAVLEMGHIPVGMEMFSAADEQQWKIIARHIDESDYYAVIIAHRLGSLTDESISYTRKEYEYARSKSIPCLGFIIDSSASWPADRVDKKASDVDALNAFKSLVLEKPVSTWSNAEDLHGKFSIALMKSFTAQPREGWIRASTATGGLEASLELVRLSAENGELRRQLSVFEATVAEEKNEEIRRTLDILVASKRSPSYRYVRNGEWHDDSEVSLHLAFRVLGPEMLIEASATDLAGTLALEIRKDREQRWDIVAINHLRDILADLMTLDLVQPSTRKHSVQDSQDYWSISEFGLEVLKRIRREALTVRRTDEDPEDATDAGDEDENLSGKRADR